MLEKVSLAREMQGSARPRQERRRAPSTEEGARERHRPGPANPGTVGHGARRARTSTTNGRTHTTRPFHAGRKQRGGRRRVAGDMTLRIDEKYEEVKSLLSQGKERGVLTSQEVRDQLPEELVADAAELEEVFEFLRAREIDVVEADAEIESEDGAIAEAIPGRRDRRKNEPVPPAEQERTNDPCGCTCARWGRCRS